MLQAIVQKELTTKSWELDGLGNGMRLKMKHAVHFTVAAWQ
jgi:hypothetical protein